MTDLAKTLAELSAKATQGACEVLAPDTERDFGVPLVATNYPGTYGPTNGMVLWAMMQPTEIDSRDTARAEANAAFTAALWNAYRTGKLIALPDDAVGRVTDAIETETVERQGRGIYLVTGHGDSTAFATAALAALTKGADHAG